MRFLFDSFNLSLYKIVKRIWNFTIKKLKYLENLDKMYTFEVLQMVTLPSG